MKKILFALLAASALPLAANAAPIKIGLSVPGLQFPFFVIMKDDAEKAAAQLGATIVFADAQNDSAKQAADIENFVAQKVDAILVSPMTVDSQVPAIEDAVKAGIPVATVDRKSNSDMVLVHVGADNVEGGRAAARYIIDKLHNKGSVIELEGTPGASAAIDRKKGFDEVIGKSNVKTLVSQTAEFSPVEKRRSKVC